MKWIILTFLYLLTGANSTYKFDYRLVYEWHNYKYATISTTNSYGNKNNNNFYAETFFDGNPKHNFIFYDLNKISLSAGTTGDFKNPGDISLPKDQTGQGSQYFPDQSKHYTMTRITDTIVKEKNYARFVVGMINLKRAKRRNVGTMIYHLDTTIDVKPIFHHFLMTFLYNKSAIPNGVISEMHYYDVYGKLVSSKYLKEMSETKFTLTLTE